MAIGNTLVAKNPATGINFFKTLTKTEMAPSDSARSLKWEKFGSSGPRGLGIDQNMMFVQSGVDGQLVRLGSFLASTTPGAPLGVS